MSVNQTKCDWLGLRLRGECNTIILLNGHNIKLLLRFSHHTQISIVLSAGELCSR